MPRIKRTPPPENQHSNRYSNTILGLSVGSYKHMAAPLPLQLVRVRFGSVSDIDQVTQSFAARVFLQFKLPAVVVFEREAELLSGVREAGEGGWRRTARGRLRSR